MWDKSEPRCQSLQGQKSLTTLGNEDKTVRDWLPKADKNCLMASCVLTGSFIVLKVTLEQSSKILSIYFKISFLESIKLLIFFIELINTLLTLK